MTFNEGDKIQVKTHCSGCIPGVIYTVKDGHAYPGNCTCWENNWILAEPIKSIDIHSLNQRQVIH